MSFAPHRFSPKELKEVCVGIRCSLHVKILVKSKPKVIHFNSFSFLEFIKFVSQQEECRKKWLAAENEAVRLKQDIAKITVRFHVQSCQSPLTLHRSLTKHFIVFTCPQYYSFFQVILFLNNIYPFSHRLKMKRLK